jgi:hypothetical protein
MLNDAIVVGVKTGVMTAPDPKLGYNPVVKPKKSQNYYLRFLLRVFWKL